jgi:hypothetical protein
LIVWKIHTRRTEHGTTPAGAPENFPTRWKYHTPLQICRIFHLHGHILDCTLQTYNLACRLGVWLFFFCYTPGAYTPNVRSSVAFWSCMPKPLVWTVRVNGPNKDRGNPLRWTRGTLNPQKLALSSPTSGGRSVGIVRSRIKATGFSFSVAPTSQLHGSATLLLPTFGNYKLVILIGLQWHNVHIKLLSKSFWLFLSRNIRTDRRRTYLNTYMNRRIVMIIHVRALFVHNVWRTYNKSFILKRKPESLVTCHSDSEVLIRGL